MMLASSQKKWMLPTPMEMVGGDNQPNATTLNHLKNNYPILKVRKKTYVYL